LTTLSLYLFLNAFVVVFSKYGFYMLERQTMIEDPMCDIWVLLENSS